MTLTVQVIPTPPTPEVKRQKPVTVVKRDNTVLTDVLSWGVSGSRNSIANSFDIGFIGQDQFTYLNPYAPSPSLFAIETGYKVSGVLQSKQIISGYPDDQGQSIRSGELLTNGSFFDKLHALMPPKAEKILIDIYRENQNAIENWQVGDDLEDLIGITSVSEVITFILSGTGISFRYMIYDYKIAYYRREDYPLNIIKDLVEFVGGYMRYNSEQNMIEILEKHPPDFSSYDFLYKDAGDIIQLNSNTKSNAFYNAVRVFGTIPDNYPEYDENEDLGPGLEEDNPLHLIDTIQGVERAPSDPYVTDPPVELIEKKFYNVWLGFDIDPNSIEVKGGSWNEDSQEYTGAKFLNYGGMVPSDQVIITDVNDNNVSQNTTTMAPGEGLVGFPWLYEDNKDSDSQKNYGIEDNVFRVVDILGKVISDLDEHPIAGATVELDFAYEDNIWQYWQYETIASDGSPVTAVFLFYLPEGSVELGAGWTDVTADYPALDPPVGFPKSTLSGNGAETEEEDGKGVFSFTSVPLSDYVATGNAPGYNEGELEITFDADNFNFLQGDGSDNNQKYKLIDTPYRVEIYGKKAQPIIFGPDENYTEDSKILPAKNIRAEIRHTRGIELTNGKIIYAPDITDSRVLSREIAIKAGTNVILDSMSQTKGVSLELPHNPWLREGMRIAVESYAKGWTASNRKVLTVDQWKPGWNVSQGREGLWDQVDGVDYI